MKREIAEDHPWVLLNLMKAFNKANDICNRERADHVDYYVETGLVNAEGGAALKQPLVQHGIRANRLVLETAAQYSFEQGTHAEAGEAGGCVRQEHDGPVVRAASATTVKEEHRCARKRTFC